MKKEMPLVSVVIPNFNNSKYIGIAIASVLEQTYKNIEIIVIDDGSTDNSLDSIKSLEGQIKVIASTNNGAASARNLGINASNGSIIAFLDSDDIWDSKKIEKQVSILLTNELDLVYCSGREFGEIAGEYVAHRARFSGNCYPHFSRNPTVAIITLGCSTAIVKREVITKSGLFDEKFKGPAEDWDFFRRVCRYGNVDFIDEELVWYRIHDRNISRSSAISYFEGNKMAISKMLYEDKSLGRLRVWLDFYLVFIKESITTLNAALFVRVLISLLRVNY
jgi:glycosyltransferase involved in cell wall biosynthesis